MILSFKPYFKPKILAGTKIHTLRDDPHDRWYLGRKIHFATGVRSKHYDCFMEGECKGIQYIEIIWDDFITSKVMEPTVYLGNSKYEDDMMPFYIPGHYGEKEMEGLAQNDGFESIEDFFKWFNTDCTKKIIHWTNFKY